ncbi:hypothetical protein Tco_1296859, partial [Tanacetum coccineum]
GVSSGVKVNLNGDGGWQDVRKSNRSGASISNNVDQRFNNGYGFGYRGGYNVRGRGGRGGMNGRGGIYQKENNESVGMKFVPVRNVGKRVDNVQVIEGEGSGNWANKGKNVDNAKSEAVKKTYGIIRNQVFGKIYDETYRSELIKINDMRSEQQRAEVELFFYSGGVLSNAVRETWTDDMIEQYETLMGEKVDKMMKEDLQEGFVQSMDEEVAEDTSDSAMFMSRDEVQNV